MGNKKEDRKKLVMMHPEEYYTMAAAERKHWWYRSLHEMVLRSINGFFSSKAIVIVDAACGTGGLMLYLAANGYKNVHGFDLSETAVRLCKEQRLDVMQGDIKNIAAYYDAGSADVIVCNDALYFLSGEEQKIFVENAGRVLRNGGLLIANVPALDAFKGMHDIRVGIGQRFNTAMVRNFFSGNQYKVKVQLYWPFALSPIVWLARFVQRLKMKFNSAPAVESDVKVGNSLINTTLYFITNTENKRLGKKPFGSSLFLVAQKNGAS